MLQFPPLVAVLLAVLLGLFFVPAAVAGPEKTPDQTPNDHPSGKDRSDKPADGETQGKSQSDPDGEANGGADKPGMDGGFDADQDGNNGCGNDDDFEDDNNGWCGGKPKVNAAVSGAAKSNVVKSKVVTKTETQQSVETGEQAAQVLGVTLVRSVPTEVAASTGTPVHLGPAPAGSLAATGRDLATTTAFALVLCAVGALLVVTAQRREAQPIPVRARSRR